MDHRETFQRSLVLEAARAIKHPNVNDLYDFITRSYPQISKATVYRNLNYLCSDGLISRITVNDKEACYDANVARHYHIRCIDCGKVFDAEMEYHEELDEEMNSRGYVVYSHELLFNGICDDCHKRNQKEQE
jgi:Fe2+ or Zn2+ uptake regulation protein